MIRSQILPRSAPARVLAVGAWLKNTACLLDGTTVHWSPLHGDLGTPEACLALDASVQALLGQAGWRVDAVAHDLHPDFESTRLAVAVAERLAVPAIAVQHHHAHVGVVQAERGSVAPAIGLALDGVGLGQDGTAWGGELLQVAGARWLMLASSAPTRAPAARRRRCSTSAWPTAWRAPPSMPRARRARASRCSAAAASTTAC